MPTKPDLRVWGLDQMRAMPRASIEQKSRQIAANLNTVPEFIQARRVFTCLSFNNEVDTWGVVDELLSDPRREVFAPRSEPSDENLHVHRYPCQLETLRIGLQQPRQDAPEVPAEQVNSLIEVCLVLGVLFDRRGYRLGYGKGFFDRFLNNKSFCTIGLGFEQQVVDELPVEPHDVPLRMLVTEERVYRFAG